MPKIDESTESRLSKACEAAKREKKPNISKIAREYGVKRITLYDRVKKGATAKSQQKPVNKALNDIQEEALVRWIIQLNNWSMPPTPKLIEAWANRLLGDSSPVGPNWVYPFIKRLPGELKLAPKKRNTKELKRIQAEDPAKLGHWYDLLECVLRGVPSRLIYNFDECGFRPDEDKNQKAVSRVNVPDLAETERGENITVVECIAADGWVMDPLFILKDNVFMESWFDEDLPPNMVVGTSPNGWISGEMALQWLDSFIKATNTPDRLKKGEKRVLIFDSHGSHLTLEFLQKCEDHKIIPFGFLPYSTHLCQPLDGKPFLAYKQCFRRHNNDISYWAGAPMMKTEFLRVIQPVRQKAFNPRIIRDSFKERGIYPVDSNKVLSGLTKRPEDPTPSPPPSSSSIEHTPKTIAKLQKN
ncbi:transposase [Penicillium taxi]|uniref:transposase n=1 Tax=Penicillium taxi TaxID=168475 RepID=UPI0025457411|nr:transposase [Penicillium taxi]KAJ5908521.1 transposase [Penicillium taxi]